MTVLPDPPALDFKPSRRALLQVGAAIGGGLLVGFLAPAEAAAPGELRTESGEVIHDAPGRRIGYGALTGRAAGLKPPADPPIKDPKDFRLIGKPLKRLDTPEKVNGQAKYGIDAMPPGVKFATFAHSPVFGGKVAHVDDSQAKLLPGVRQVVVLDDLVAVVGDHMWAAKQGLDALNITWDEGPNANVNTALVRQR